MFVEKKEVASIIKKIESIVKFKKTWQFIDSVMLVSNCMRYHSCERIELFLAHILKLLIL